MNIEKTEKNTTEKLIRDSTYRERVYAAITGKAIGVYQGRPIEGWTYERIMEQVGEVWTFVHEKVGKPLIVTDDDISGTLAFIRTALDSGRGYATTSKDLGAAWLNYLLEDRSVLWWGGMSRSTEHTAYLRLRQGINAPRSGSAELNGKTVAEQIGGQIFIDGWALIAPGAPNLAADLAEMAARVSHDGEAVLAARSVAAIEAEAFVSSDTNHLLDTALSVVPHVSDVARLIRALRELRTREADWRVARQWLSDNFGYEHYKGLVPVIPNHGLIILSLLYGRDFREAMMIVNTSGWDTDCNAGNLGCILGIKDGLEAIPLDLRTLVADRIYVPTANVGGTITDVAREAERIASIGHFCVSGEKPSVQRPRFDFTYDGSLRGFRGAPGTELENVMIPGGAGRALRIRATSTATATTATFIPPDALDMQGYDLHAAPTLYAGQEVRALVHTDGVIHTPLTARIVADYYGTDDATHTFGSADLELHPGQQELRWTVPQIDGAVVHGIGVEICGDTNATAAHLVSLDWQGSPTVTFRPSPVGELWKLPWVITAGSRTPAVPEGFLVRSTYGEGFLLSGSEDWTDYRVEARVTPSVGERFGLAGHVLGLNRFVAVVATKDHKLALVYRHFSDEIVLDEVDFAWSEEEPLSLWLELADRNLRAGVGQAVALRATGPALAPGQGGIALLVDRGFMLAESIEVRPLGSR